MTVAISFGESLHDGDRTWRSSKGMLREQTQLPKWGYRYVVAEVGWVDALIKSQYRVAYLNVGQPNLLR